MKRITVKLPNGEQYRIDAPDDVTAAKWLESIFTAILLAGWGRPQDDITVTIRA